jgi:hypothetical protein
MFSTIPDVTGAASMGIVQIDKTINPSDGAVIYP